MRIRRLRLAFISVLRATELRATELRAGEAYQFPGEAYQFIYLIGQHAVRSS